MENETLCLELGIRVNYIITTKDGFKLIAIKDNCSNILEKFRKESNEQISI